MDKQKLYEVQDEFVISSLVSDLNYELLEATELWYHSKTRHLIQEVYDMYYLSRVRCLDELEKEINKDLTWMYGTFN